MFPPMERGVCWFLILHFGGLDEHWGRVAIVLVLFPHSPQNYLPELNITVALDKKSKYTERERERERNLVSFLNERSQTPSRACVTDRKAGDWRHANLQDDAHCILKIYLIICLL